MARFRPAASKPIGPEVEDAQIVNPRTRWVKNQKKWLIPLLIVVFTAAGLCVEHLYLAPARDKQLIANALTKRQATPAVDNFFKKSFPQMSFVDQQLAVMEVLRPSETERADPTAVKAYVASLQEAARADIPEAGLNLGKAQRDGIFGKVDAAAALKTFKTVMRETETGASVGDPVALYVRALLLSEGLGIEPDANKARELATRAGPGLDGSRLKSIAMSASWGSGIFAGSKDVQLSKVLGQKMIDKKMAQGPWLRATACAASGDAAPAACNRKWYAEGAEAGIELAMASYGLALLADGEPLDTSESWFSAGQAESSSSERYQHAVIKVMLADNDSQLVNALHQMHKSLLEDELINEKFSDLSLAQQYFALDDFEKTLKTSSIARFDNFLIALRVRGLLTDRSDWLYEQTFPWFADRPDLQRRFGNPALIRKAEFITKAFKEGRPIASIALSRFSDAESASSKLRQQTNKWGDVAVDGASHSSNPEAVTNQKLPKTFAFESAPLSASGLNPAVRDVISPAAKDREEQETTGYLKGQPKQAVGGLSKFTVDNMQGTSDSVARIYLGGTKPAVRSVYVKKGETFSAKSLKPGTYVFRYRFIGSDDTYESDQPFVLEETKTDRGTRYSNVTVTLFKSRDGNMKTRKVDPSAF